MDALFVLFSWLPPPLSYLCIGGVVIFFLVGAFRLIKFILDLIPFL